MEKDKTNIKVLIEGKYINLENVFKNLYGFNKLKNLMLINDFKVSVRKAREPELVYTLNCQITGTYNGSYFSHGLDVIQAPKDIKQAVDVFMRYGEFERIVKGFEGVK